MFKNLINFTSLTLIVAIVSNGSLSNKANAQDAGAVGITTTIENNTGVPVNDLHLVYELPGGLVGNELPLLDDNEGIIDVDTKQCSSLTPPNEKDGNWRLTCEPDFTRILNPGESFEINLNFTSKLNGVIPIPRFSYWTFEDENIRNLGVPEAPSPLTGALGFEAKGLGNQLTYSLINSNSEDVFISNLQFSIVDNQPTELFSSSMLNFNSFLESITLPADSSLSFSPGSISPGQFLIAKMDTTLMSDSTIMQTTIHEHEAVIPEASSPLSLLFFSTLGVGSTLLRKQKQKKLISKAS